MAVKVLLLSICALLAVTIQTSSTTDSVQGVSSSVEASSLNTYEGGMTMGVSQEKNASRTERKIFVYASIATILITIFSIVTYFFPLKKNEEGNASVSVRASGNSVVNTGGGTQIVHITTSREQGAEFEGYPKTQEDKNSVASVMGIVQHTLVLINNQYIAYEEALDEARSYLTSPTKERMHSLQQRCTFSLKEMERGAAQSVGLPSDVRRLLMNSPVRLDDLEALLRFPGIVVDSFRQTLELLPLFMGSKTMADPAERQTLLNIYYEMYAYEIDVMFYNMCELLAPFNEASLKKFRDKGYPLLTKFPHDKPFRYKEKEVERIIDTIYAKQLEAANRMAAIVGNMNMSYNAEKNSFVERIMRENGVSREEALQIIDNMLNK